MWRMYEFDHNWPEFYAAWKSDAVQAVMERNVQQWIRDKFDGRTDITWNRGDPLWDLTRGDYWIDTICDRADAKLDFKASYEAYARTMKAQGLPVANKDDFCDTIFDRAFEEACRECSPRPGTLESLVLPDGDKYLAEALAAAARKLFPRSLVIVTVSEDDIRHVLLPLEKLVFDLVDYYFWTRHDEFPYVLDPTYAF